MPEKFRERTMLYCSMMSVAETTVKLIKMGKLEGDYEGSYKQQAEEILHCWFGMPIDQVDYLLREYDKNLEVTS